MPFYQTKGEVPKKRHTIFKNPAGGIYYEELVSREGFSYIYSNLYHLNMPTQVMNLGQFEKNKDKYTFAKNDHKPYHFKWENLNKVFKYFGEEKFSKRIARKIIDIRQTKKINTEDLTKIVDSVKKFQKYKINNSTKVFQALRIYVNREISELINGLINAFNLLPVGGIIAVVTFHSIEDKIVKFFFKNYSEIKNSSRYIPNESNKIKRFLLKNKKPIIPSNEELKLNPPSRSAKLRFAIKTSHESNFDEFKGKFRQLTDIEKLQF